MDEHNHKFQKEGTTWACFGWPGACGLRAPACFTPKDEALTPRALRDRYIDDMLDAHFIVIRVP